MTEKITESREFEIFINDLIKRCDEVLTFKDQSKAEMLEQSIGGF